MAVAYQADESGVSTAVPECSSQTSSDPEDLPPVNIRVSVFFDGTGNNLFNTDYRVIRGRTIGGADNRGSYLASYSNNARLATNITTTNSENDYHFPVYVEGIGTYHSREDHERGMGFGTGAWGVINRVSQCINRVKNAISSLCNENRRIQSLKIDAFGFSRGAASARYFVYCVFSKTIRGEDGRVIRNSLIDQLINDGFQIDDYKMPFIGLFDTVASYRPGADLNYDTDTNQLHLNSIQHANVEKVVQLAAADEHRVNFPLTNILSAGTKGTQIFLPGVHSDIGGGYNNITNGDMRENNLCVFEVETDRYSVTQTARAREACVRVRDNLISLGWYNSSNELIVQLNEETLNYQVVANRRNISNKYSWVPLHIMAEKAGEKDLQFDLSDFPLSDDERLQPFKDKIQNNTHDDQWWMTSVDQTLKDMRHSFFHFSSHFKLLRSWGTESWPNKPHLYSQTRGFAGIFDNSLSIFLHAPGATGSIRRRRILEG